MANSILDRVSIDMHEARTDADARGRAATLARHAAHIRRTSLQMVHRARLGHPGGDLSAADILAVLYFDVLRVDPGGAASSRTGIASSSARATAPPPCTPCSRMPASFPKHICDSYMQPLSPLNGHPDRNKVPGVEANTGPLGHGLPIAVGTALAARMDAAAWRTFVLTGDGELQEGSNWEAAMAAAHFRLDNLTVIVDRNRLQQGDATETDGGPRAAARSLAVVRVGRRRGGRPRRAGAARRPGARPLVPGRPTCVIAHTHKGQGVSFMADRVEWHHRVPTDAELERALAEIDDGRPAERRQRRVRLPRRVRRRRSSSGRADRGSSPW